MTRSLTPGGWVLDLGCGCGVLLVRDLAQHGLTVTGMNISEVQVTRAPQLVRRGAFLRADLADVAFADQSFDAACRRSAGTLSTVSAQR